MFKKKVFIIILIPIFIFSIFNTFSKVEARIWECKDYGNLSQEEMDEVLSACNAEIKKEQQELKKKVDETNGVKSEITLLDRKIKLSKNYIYKKTLQLKRLNRDIGDNRSDIDKIKDSIEKLKKSLRKFIYKKYQYNNYTTVETLFSNKTISEFFQHLELIEFIEKKILVEVKELKYKKDDLELLIGELEERNAVEKRLVDEKKGEQVKIKKNKEYKDRLLGILKKEVGTKKITLANKEKIKKDILRRKFTVASGDKVTFGEAYNILLPYEKTFKMDTAFVLAVLFQESGHKGKIGGNIGQCTYDQKNSHGSAKRGYTVMSNSQKKNFVKIMDGLGIDPSKQKISCPIPRDGSYGGAMGPAQFMPNTWMGIRASAAKIIGKRPEQMSPFTNHDAFIASASYLKAHYYSKSCSDYANKYKHISSTRTLRERCAAAKYYAGGNWYKHRMGYGESVVKRANKFRQDIKTLNE